MLDIINKTRYNGKVEFFAISLTKENPHFQFYYWREGNQ